MKINKGSNDYLVGYETGYNKGRSVVRMKHLERESLRLAEKVAEKDVLVVRLTEQLRTSWVNEEQYKRLYDNLLEDFYILATQRQIYRRRMLVSPTIDEALRVGDN